MKLNPYYVAYIDILGFSEMVSEDCKTKDAPKFLEKLHTIHTEASRLIPDGSYSITQFSDSIVFTRPFSIESKQLKEFLRMIAEYQLLLLKQGLLCRGGVDFGEHYSSQTFMFSEGLIKAYRLESTVARYPRIIISNDLLGLVGDSDLSDIVLKENDMLSFIDFVAIANLEEDKAVIVEQTRALMQNPKTPSILEKVLWLAAYVDSIFDTDISPQRFIK